MTIFPQYWTKFVELPLLTSFPAFPLLFSIIICTFYLCLQILTRPLQWHLVRVRMLLGRV